MRMFARLWVSLADMTRLISSRSHSSARSHPRTFGTRAVYITSGWRRICLATASASRRFGIALGDTNEVISIRASPVSDNRSISAIFSSVGTNSGSIWKPSRTDTSLMRTRRGAWGSHMVLSFCSSLVWRGGLRPHPLPAARGIRRRRCRCPPGSLRCAHPAPARSSWCAPG
ncbi:hypothetical protein D9M72_550120 [compost metagenome]